MQTIVRTCFVFYVATLFLATSACQQNPKIQQSESELLPMEEQKTVAPATTVDSASGNYISEQQADELDDVYLLGWSENGRVLAYRSFYLSDAISRHSSIHVEVVDIVSDKIIWNSHKDWDDGKVGGDTNERSPADDGEAWERVSEEVVYNMSKFGIQATTDPSSHEAYCTFPIRWDDNEYSVELTVGHPLALKSNPQMLLPEEEESFCFY